MVYVETDSQSGAEVYQLTDELQPADNIYGEQPYSSSDGGQIAVRYYPIAGKRGSLSILDIEETTQQVILRDQPRFPAFHAWGEHLYYQESVGAELLLKRCCYQTCDTETIVALPATEGRFSYGTVSPDGCHYAVSVHREDGSCRVLLVDLVEGDRKTLAETSVYYFKHEQFSLDGCDRVLIQANELPDVNRVQLGAMEIDREGVEWLAADRPHTPRPTGHETWIGATNRVFFSTARDEDEGVSTWTAGVGEAAPVPVCQSRIQFGHVSVSRCGRYWVADAMSEEGVPLYVGSLESGRYRRLLCSRTALDGKQWSHTHPYLTADNAWLICTSNRSGIPQVYGARVPKEFWRSL